MSTDINNTDPVALVVAPPVAGKPGRRKGGLLWLLNPRLAVGLVILLVMGLGSFILPMFAPADPSIQATYMRNLPMSGSIGSAPMRSGRTFSGSWSLLSRTR